MTQASVRLGMIVALVALPGCAATQSVHQQRFLELRTPHFEILSSLGADATRALARDLELFHAGVEFALGLPVSDSTPVSTRVFAFDDRGFARPFAVRAAKVYLVNRVSAPILVFRTPSDWDERATRAVRQSYARRLLRRRDPTRRPLWYEIGLGQYASTVEVGATHAQVGAIVVEHVQLLRDWNATSLRHLFEVRDLSRYSPQKRELFDAQTWALVHTLKFRDPGKRGGDALARTLEVLDPPDGAKLAQEVYAHIRQPEFQEIAVRPHLAWRAADADLETIPSDLARAALGDLALAIGKVDLARDYFERALSANPSNARAHLGLGAVDAKTERWQDADAHVQRALGLGPDDPRNHRVAGDILSAQARTLESGPERKRLLDLARAHYQRSLEFDSENVESRVGFAATCLFEAQDAERGLEWLESARALRPGSLEIDLLAARLNAKLGRFDSARRLAADVVSRTRWSATEREAREILEAAAESRES